jgi:hypothetical protein
MKEKHIGGVESKEIFYEEVEGFAREKIREHLQDLLEKTESWQALSQTRTRLDVAAHRHFTHLFSLVVGRYSGEKSLPRYPPIPRFRRSAQGAWNREDVFMTDHKNRWLLSVPSWN